MNCSFCPATIDGAGFGVTAIDCRIAVLIVRATPGEFTPLNAADMLLLPTATPVARPVELIVTKAVLLEFQVAKLLRSATLPSE